MSATVASEHVQKMVELESRGRGDLERAMCEVARRTGLTYWQVSHLRKGNAKTCDIGVFARIKLAYLNMCADMISKLSHEMHMEGQVSDDDFSDLQRDAALLAEKVQSQKEALRSGARGSK